MRPEAASKARQHKASVQSPGRSARTRCPSTVPPAPTGAITLPTQLMKFKNAPSGWGGVQEVCREHRGADQGTALESSRTENPTEPATSDSRRSPQTKLLLDGRCPHQIKDAASCRLSAARKEYLSINPIATSRTWSSGRISLQPRLRSRRRAIAPLLIEVCYLLLANQAANSAVHFYRLPHQTTGANLRR